jgi:hypothetical protein
MIPRLAHTDLVISRLDALLDADYIHLNDKAQIFRGIEEIKRLRALLEAPDPTASKTTWFDGEPRRPVRTELSPKPMIPEGLLVRGPRPYTGEIEVGAIYAWEPDLPHARQLCIVSKVQGGIVWTFDFPEQRLEVWNEESRFRGAVVPTLYKKMEVTGKRKE